VPSRAYQPLPSGIELVAQDETGTNGSGRESNTLWLVLGVRGAADDQVATERVREHFAPRTTTLTPWTLSTIRGYAGHGRRSSGFTIITMAPVEQYLAQGRLLPLAFSDEVRDIVHRDQRALVLVELEP
jgi:hypothetical protein